MQSQSTQLNRLQAVINATARLILSGHRRDRITPLLVQLHRLRISQTTEYKSCILDYRCLHGMLASSFQSVSAVTIWCHLHSAVRSQLIVPATNCSTLGECIPRLCCTCLERSSTPNVICTITFYFYTTFKETSTPLQFLSVVLSVFTFDCTVPLKRMFSVTVSV